MIKYLGVITLFVLSIFLQAQEPSNKEIISRAIHLDDKEANPSAFSDQLNNLLKATKVIALGEQSHGEGNVYTTKVELIKYLHEEMGYDVLAFESGFYECAKAWRNIETGKDVREQFGRSVFPIWIVMKELKELTDYVEQTLKTDRPLRLIGFDNQITGEIFKTDFGQDLKRFLQANNSPLIKTAEWKDFETKIYDRYRKKPKKRRLEPFLKTIDLVALEVDKYKNDEDYAFWAQVLINLRTCYEDRIEHAGNMKNAVTSRDSMMAENIKWYTQQNPTSKIILWAATSHIMFNHDAYLTFDRKVLGKIATNYYASNVSMGGHLKQHFGAAYYAVGFTAGTGQYGPTGYSRIHTLEAPAENSLEYIFHSNKLDRIIIPLNKVKGYSSRTLGNQVMNSDVADVLDAVIYLEKINNPAIDFKFLLQLNPDATYLFKFFPEEEEERLKAEYKARKKKEKNKRA